VSNAVALAHHGGKPVPDDATSTTAVAAAVAAAATACAAADAAAGAAADASRSSSGLILSNLSLFTFRVDPHGKDVRSVNVLFLQT
jgi:hypothetical protein